MINFLLKAQENQKCGSRRWEQKIIDDTGKWKNLIGVTCTYGVNYKDEVVFAQENVIKESNKKIRVKDKVGKIWFVMPNDLVEVK